MSVKGTDVKLKLTMNKIFKIFVFAVILGFAFTACDKNNDIANLVDDTGKHSCILELTDGEFAQAIDYLKPDTDVTIYGAQNNNATIVTGTTKEKQNVLYRMLNANTNTIVFASYNHNTSLICFEVGYGFNYYGSSSYSYFGGTFYVTDAFENVIYGVHN